MSEEILENIKREVKKTGHPLSIEISGILNEKSWYVKNGPRYYSENIDTFREIDVVSIRESSFIKDAFDTLIIECKKSDSGNWVFFRQNRKNRDQYTLNIAQQDGTILVGKIYSWIEDHKLFQKHYYFDKQLSTYYFIPFMDPDNEKKGKVLDKAINQVIMATGFYLGQREGTHGRIMFYYPIIVFDGRLFEVIHRNGEMEVEEVRHVSLLVEMEMSEPTKVGIINTSKGQRLLTSKKFIVDVVQRDYFRDFLMNFDPAQIRKIN